MIKNIIRSNNSFKYQIPELLNINNDKLKEKIGQIFGTNITSDNISIILNNSKRYMNSKIFEKKEELIEEIQHKNKTPKVLGLKKK